MSTNRSVYAVITLLFFCFYSMGQTIDREVISNTGKGTKTSDFIVSYTVGEPISNVISDGEFILIQGFEQVRLDTVLVGLLEGEIEHEIKIYPNPTFAGFYVEYDQLSLPSLTAEMYSVQGKQIHHARELSSNNYIDLSQHAPGVYLLRLMLKEKEKFKVVRIEKLN